MFIYTVYSTRNDLRRSSVMSSFVGSPGLNYRPEN